MAILSPSPFTVVRRLTTAPVRPSLRPHRQMTLCRPYRCLQKPQTRLASQWSRRRRPTYNPFEGSYTSWFTNPAVRLGAGALGVAGGIFYVSNIESVPVSGRRRFNFISPQREAALAQDSYRQVLRLFGDKILPPNHPYSQLVNRVVARLLPVSGLQEQQWEIKVIDDPKEKNAFVIPGGKVFVFSGILPICEGEDGLAHVLGHEIGHTVAHHTAEKLSKSGFELILALIISFTFDVSGYFARFIVDTALKKTNSRTQESEADHIGLLMVAKACYDPNAAVGLWHRMAKAEKFTQPQFLSTHPTSQNRMTQIEHWLPEAADIQSRSECGNMIGLASRFRDTFRRQGTGLLAERFGSDDESWF